VSFHGRLKAGGRRRVLIAYRILPDYRVDFYNRLRGVLAAEDIELRLVYGQPTLVEATKRDTTDLEWAERVESRFLRVGSRYLVWQPITKQARAADLVVVEQASRLLVNYPLLAQQSAGLTKVAFWGHGANLQTHTAAPGAERVKRFVSRYPHWWFAYTDAVRKRVVDLGYPEERITVVQNAIDTTGLRQARRAVSEDQLRRFRSTHDLGEGPICAFIGGLYAEKRLPFLIEAADEVHRQRPSFRLIVIGDGPDRSLVEQAAATRPHIRYLGGLFGSDKVEALAVAELMLMPGLVGLAVLDAFALELPLVTTAVDYHSPEIEYLTSGANGVVVQDADDPLAYAKTVAGLLENEAELTALRGGCREAAEVYTVAAMTARFADGIAQALEAA